jgi:hypothetical protein
VTEAEWLASEQAKDMFRCLRDQFNTHRKKVGRRKLRLFGCACCRQHWQYLTDPRSRAAVEYAERLADGEADERLQVVLCEEARLALHDGDLRRLDALGQQPQQERDAEREAEWAVVALLHRSPESSAYADVAMRFSVGEGHQPVHRLWLERLRELALLLRDIFGNPFRIVVFPKSWRSSTAVALAVGMYKSRDFTAMPVLADALEEAGCSDSAVLAHCREPGTHVRGCWVVDLVLNR